LIEPTRGALKFLVIQLGNFKGGVLGLIFLLNLLVSVFHTVLLSLKPRYTPSQAFP
jgi:hypothetical protein